MLLPAGKFAKISSSCLNFGGESESSLDKADGLSFNSNAYPESF